MTQQPGTFVWFELVTPNASKAQAFYGEVLGWKVEKFPMEGFTYEMIKAGDRTIGGYAQPRLDAPPHWISYVAVVDVDAAVAKAVARGGKVVQPAADTPTVGRMARIADPFGAQLFLFRSSQGESSDWTPTAGQFGWNELWTPDAKKALAFYEEVVGWTHKDMDMGPGGTYHVLESDGKSRGGVMTSQDPKAPPMWLPYVNVTDADAVTGRAKKLGGKVIAPPSDIPDIGRFAILADPDGAVFAVIKPAAPVA